MSCSSPQQVKKAAPPPAAELRPLSFHLLLNQGRQQPRRSVIFSSWGAPTVRKGTLSSCFCFRSLHSQMVQAQLAGLAVMQTVTSDILLWHVFSRLFAPSYVLIKQNLSFRNNSMHHVLNVCGGHRGSFASYFKQLHDYNASLYSFICCLQFNVQRFHTSIDITHHSETTVKVQSPCARYKPLIYLWLFFWKRVPSLEQALGTIGPEATTQHLLPVKDSLRILAVSRPPPERDLIEMNHFSLTLLPML